MKKLLYTLICTLFIFTASSQIIIDTVSLGPGYMNQTWYSLENDEQGNEPNGNWDLAFDVSAFGTSIHINSVTGTTLWTYPLGDTADWNAVDTTGIGTWIAKYNSDTTWTIGAFDQGAVASNAADVGWGIYNFITHIITGDSLFVIKLANGDYKKLWIENIASGAYNFKYANLDGSDLQNAALNKANFEDKNFGYYSIQNNTALDREPVASLEWDILFTQYTGFIPVPYALAGVLSNKGVSVAQAGNIAAVDSYTDFSSHSFTTEINEIGYDWKTFAGTYIIEDSLIYFVETVPGDIWKLVFTGFGGSANGNFIFSKELLSTVGIEEAKGPVASLSVYPNPAKGENVNIIYNLYKETSKAVLNIYDIAGRTVIERQLQNSTGLSTMNLNTADFHAGVYIISISTEGKRIQQKLIVQ